MHRWPRGRPYAVLRFAIHVAVRNSPFPDMWFVLRKNNSSNGIGELYSYLPLTSNNAKVLANVPPKTVENNNYGFSVGRGAWTFHRGAWNTIAERILLNDPGKSNGEHCSAPSKRKQDFIKYIYLR